MPLSAHDYLAHPEFGPMPEGMRMVVQKCCGLSTEQCCGQSEVARSNLTTERRVTDAELSAAAVASDPTGGSYS